MTAGPGETVLTLRFAGAHPASREIIGSVELQQFAGTTWTVARVALIDQAENDRVISRPAAPAVSVTRG